MRALALALLCSSCVQFNDECRPDNSEVVGSTLRSLDIRPAILTTEEAAAGDLLADALRSATKADLALVPADLFHTGSACGTRTLVERGALRSGDIDDLLPSDDTVVVIGITSDALDRVLEHSVASLRTGGQSAQFPGFLQPSGVFFSVDCSQQAQSLSADNTAIAFPGQRISAITVGGQTPQAAQTFHLATTSSMAASAFGYVDLKPAMILVDTGEHPRDMLIDYLQRNSPVDPEVEGRILLGDTCK